MRHATPMLETSSASTVSPQRTGGRNALLSAAWIGVLIAATFLPLSWKVKLGTTGPLHLWFHFAGFGAAGFLLFRSARTVPGRLFVCAALMLLAGLQETAESRMSGNRMEWVDVMADFAGLLLALLPAAWELAPVRRPLHPAIIRLGRRFGRAEVVRRITQVWLLLLIGGSLQPARPGPVVAMHLGIHVLAFGGAAFLLLLVSSSQMQEIRAVVGMCLVGLTVEFLQHVIYGNVMEWWDVRDDAIAVATAFALYRIVWLSSPAAQLFKPAHLQRGETSGPAVLAGDEV